MKRLVPFLAVVLIGLSALSAEAQVSIHANINLPLPLIPPIPHVHVYAQTPPAVIYQGSYVPAPQYYPGYETDRVVIADPSCGYDGYYCGYRDERFHDRPYRFDNDYREYEHHDRGHHYGWGRGDQRRW